MPISLNEHQLFSNNAVSLLAVPLSASDTSLVLMTGYGDLFPQPVNAGDFFLVTLEDQGLTKREIIKVTGRSGDTLTGLVRGQENTVAQNWSASQGDDTLVDHRVTAETMRRAMELPIAAGSSVSKLADLTDVADTPATAGQVLKWNGSSWAPASDVGVPSLGSIDGHTDVDTTSVPPAIGQVLKWNGTNWVPSADSTFVPGSINAFTDVDTASIPPTIGQVLKWNGTNWVPGNESAGSGTAWIHGENTNGTQVPNNALRVISTAQYTHTNRMFKFIVSVTSEVTYESRAFEILLIVSGNLQTNSEIVSANQYGSVGPKIPGDVHAILDSNTKTINLEWENTSGALVTVNCVRVQHF